MGRLEGKVAFLTGAGAGIAKATALAYAREGAKVAIIELNNETGAAAEKDVRAAGGDAIFIQTDVTDFDSVKRAVDATVAKFGKLDVLLNCAGGSLQEDVPVHEMDLDVWHRTVALNLLHPFLTCRHAIPHMIKAGGGSIINMTSHLGLMGSIKPAYAATKGGIISFTKTLAAQYADYGIRANGIAPGSTLTDGTRKLFYGDDGLFRESVQKMLDHVPLGRPASVDEYAVAALFLADPENSYMNGHILTVDGGWTAGYTREF